MFGGFDWNGTATKQLSSTFLQVRAFWGKLRSVQSTTMVTAGIHQATSKEALRHVFADSPFGPAPLAAFPGAPELALPGHPARQCAVSHAVPWGLDSSWSRRDVALMFSW